MVDQFFVELNGGDVNSQNVLLDISVFVVLIVDSVVNSVLIDIVSVLIISVLVQMLVDNNVVVVFFQVNVDIVGMMLVVLVIILVLLLLIDQVNVMILVVLVQDLVMNFFVDCWLEVSDVIGKKLFSGLQCKGGNLNLSGQVLYKLKIGVLVVVQIQYLGKFVDLSCFIRINQVVCLIFNVELLLVQ